MYTYLLYSNYGNEGGREGANIPIFFFSHDAPPPFSIALLFPLNTCTRTWIENYRLL